MKIIKALICFVLLLTTCASAQSAESFIPLVESYVAECQSADNLDALEPRLSKNTKTELSDWSKRERDKLLALLKVLTALRTDSKFEVSESQIDDETAKVTLSTQIPWKYQSKTVYEPYLFKLEGEDWKIDMSSFLAIRESLDLWIVLDDFDKLTLKAERLEELYPVLRKETAASFDTLKPDEQTIVLANLKMLAEYYKTQEYVIDGQIVKGTSATLGFELPEVHYSYIYLPRKAHFFRTKKGWLVDIKVPLDELTKPL